MNSSTVSRQVWNESFKEQKEQQAYNTAPVEALVRNVSYYLRARYKQSEYSKLHFLEMGSGAGPNLIWLAQKGISVSGIDISPTAIELCRESFKQAGLSDKLVHMIDGSVDNVPLPDESFDGIIESCVFQHLDKATRLKTFAEVKRLLKPGGVFVGHMLGTGHTVYQKRKNEQMPNDPGTLLLSEGGAKFYLTNQGLTHFYSAEELKSLLAGFSIVDPLLTTYQIPQEEAKKRGYSDYLQSMWIVYAVK